MPSAGRVGVYFLDVGQGDCTVVVGDEASSGAVLIDCNDAYVAQRFFIDHRINHLRAVVATHLDLDHIRGLLPLMRWFLDNAGTIDAVYVGLDRHPQGGLGRAAASLIDQVLQWEKAGRLSVYRPERDAEPKTIWALSDWRVEIVLPTYASVLGLVLEDGQEPNVCSAVVRVCRKNAAITVGGDATIGSWERLEPLLVRADVLRVPHHAGRIDADAEKWTTRDFYSNVDARTLVISVGSHNSHGHPDPTVIEDMEPAHRRVLCTQVTKQCHKRPEDIRAGALARQGAVHYPYRHRVHQGGKRSRPKSEVPCAGSVVAWLDQDGIVHFEPKVDDWHEQFVRTLECPCCLGGAIGPAPGDG